MIALAKIKETTAGTWKPPESGKVEHLWQIRKVSDLVWRL